MDVSARSLSFATDAPDIPILNELSVKTGNLSLSLRLLGASHQAVVTCPDGTLSETVAYRDDVDPYLPASHTQVCGEWVHQFSSLTETVPWSQLRDRAHAQHSEAKYNPDLLVGVFGAEREALTALEITARDPLGWRTVHTYPQYGQIVTTHSVVRRRDQSSPARRLLPNRFPCTAPDHGNYLLTLILWSPDSSLDDSMQTKDVKVLVIIVVIVVGFIATAVACVNLGNDDPVDFIESTYTRSAHLDEDSGRAYTTDLTPAQVRSEIGGAVSPVDARTDAGNHYLQYAKYIIAVTATATGTKILIDDYRRGHQRHSVIITGWGWSSSPPSGFRGGGPGSGK
ncbi:DUF2617 family protein [Natronoglycomyces albus]|uniref:DUF2617 family protein n=1 Tax=Natronoglycomyces albus TaxID=2811108 RepID=A0A895XW78_9ACTN|nr:DUF2617 family protein [Natronoglycomyces albus]